MTDHSIDEERVFHIARDLSDPANRVMYLEQVCADNESLRRRVEALLEIEENDASFLKSQAEPASTQDASPLTEAPGQQIGRYKLLQQIGEGGMGTVFMAEQTRPVTRRVALKIIKQGMDTKAVIARFEAERQALAMMDHPGIAKVLDAGTTDSGRPYFVMELVKGVPITEYCDQHKLPIHERLKLFIEVCQAVQHAHQKGIIHRDIKPSNVLVAMYDGKPVPKIIDFGVAKATNQRLTERTMFTQFGQIVGTLEYMSPEQAQFNQLDVDTRSDIYSLGVLLYELLTGMTPFDGKRLRSTAYEEVMRILKEEEPPKPSTRISTLGYRAESVSTSRSSNPSTLGGLIRGDLDWIVMKALEKDRNRRYESCNGLGRDLARFLDSEPVSAHPPSLTYQVRKMVGRNKAVALGTLAVVASLLVGLIGSTWTLHQLNQKRDELERTVSAQHSLIIESALNHVVAGDSAAFADTLVLAEDSDVPADWIHTLRGIARLQNGENSLASDEFESALEINKTNVSAQSLLAWTYFHNGDHEEWSHHVAFLEDANAREEWQDFDEFFLGYAYFYVDYSQAADRFGQVVAKHPTWLLARVMHASAQSHEALAEVNRDKALAALNEIQLTSKLLDDSPLVLLMESFAYCSVLYFDPEANNKESFRTSSLAAAHALEQYPAYSVGSIIRVKFFELIGDTRGAQQARDDLVNHGRGFLMEPVFEQWFADGKDVRIQGELLDRGTEVELMKAMVFAWNNHDIEAMRICKQVEQENTSWIVRQKIIWVYMLCGDSLKAMGRGREWLDSVDDTSVQRAQERDRDAVEFVASGMDETALSKPGLSANKLGNLQFLLGLGALSEGDGKTAIGWFRTSLETQDDWEISRYAKAFHDRLIRDGSLGEGESQPKEDAVETADF